MDKIHSILSNLRDGIPQALARFNDGEMTGIIRPGSVVARGDQQVPKDLSDKLKEALQHEQDNYWVGIPCSVCYPHLHSVALSYVDDEYDYLTKAVVTTNRNWKLFTTEFPKITDGRLIRYVGGIEHNTDELKKYTGIDVSARIITPMKNAWSDYNRIKDIYNSFSVGDIVLLSCGPMARVLAREWFEQRPDCTFLDIGSCFDPWTRDVWLNCHKGKVKTCLECN